MHCVAKRFIACLAKKRNASMRAILVAAAAAVAVATELLQLVYARHLL